ncbi:MAG: TerC family protein [Candidatus Nitricoxidivorans perseverans]|uniref:TerC family protein n=1 Tax=Candidatus Nitricoxidivorans perseverans TaxID=2975601 RepID=A0AA49IYB2_9PROT|nr:MAG: TerC family protein [Candidatus Nitricoxidivorans perseverans]
MPFDLSSPDFWVAVLQIIAIDIVLSGDNAVVIALACRNLPAEQRRLGILWGVGGAIGLRVVLTAFAAGLLGYPYLKLIGGFLLLWIGVKLLLPEGEEGHDIQGAGHLWGAVKTIIVADFVMSLDNVIAVAAAARDSIFLLLFGLAVSIPLIVWTSQLFLKLMERFPVIITLGAGLLGWVAGGMLATDVAVKGWVEAAMPLAHYVASAVCALFVVVVGNWLAWRKAGREERRIV